jgi:hypothetical protein
MIIQLADKRVAFVAIVRYEKGEIRSPAKVVAAMMLRLFRIRSNEYELIDPTVRPDLYKDGMEEVIDLLNKDNVNWSYADEQQVVIDTWKLIDGVRREARQCVRLLVMPESKLKEMGDAVASSLGEGSQAPGNSKPSRKGN